MGKKCRSLLENNIIFLIIFILYLGLETNISIFTCEFLLRRMLVWIPAALGFYLIWMSGSIHLAAGTQVILEASLMLHLKLRYDLGIGWILLLNLLTSLLIALIFCLMHFWFRVSMEITGIALYLLMSGISSVLKRVDSFNMSEILYSTSKELYVLLCVICVGLLALVYLGLKYTMLGRRFRLIRSYGEQAQLAGLPVKQIQYMVYFTGCILIGISGMILGFRSALPTSYDPLIYTMYIIAIVAIGGTRHIGHQNIVGKTVRGCAGLVMLTSLGHSVGASAAMSMVLVGFFALIGFILDRQHYRLNRMEDKF